MTALKELLVSQIRANGPMTMAEYMAACLMHPEHGYYATRDPLGAAGDFTTAPEMSQMFGELIGLSLAQAWMDQGAPEAVVLAELGPGRGTLMADVLRATKGVPGFHEAARVNLVETSPALRQVQAQTVKWPGIAWRESVADLPELPLFVVANEFFDALPVRQVQREGERWRERLVGLEGEALAIGLSDPKAMAPLEHRLEDTRDGDIVEFSPMGESIAAEIGGRIAKHGGAALIVDYGDWRSLGDTWQAVKGHEAIDPLAEPGGADLTAHVDFEALARAVPCRYSRLTPQGVFLERLGITARAQALAKGLEGDRLETHIAAHRRLTHPHEMGTLFKVMALTPEGAALPPGLDT
ncbi:MAG: SAM-dependent methyltransferase [Roseovarius sp.]|uniref:class I SAM-dependent methyltransferase n=1 Tax=Roseovarius sp. TaxID=1486281 RepID=UPI0032EFA03E